MFEGLKNKLKSFIKKEKKEVEKLSELEGKTEETKIKVKEVEKAEKAKQEKETAKEKKPVHEKEAKLTIKTKLKKAITGKIKLTEKDLEPILWDFQLELLEADVSINTAEKLCSKIKEELIDKEIPKDEFEEKIKQSLKKAVEEAIIEPDFDILEEAKKKKPFVILLLGPNGHGKTTTIGKLAAYFLKNGLTCVIAASDTFRAAAIEQLEKIASKAGVKVIKHNYGADPAAVAFDAVKHAKSKGINVVLIDTAGRSELNKNLMEQMKKIARVVSPDLVVYIGEAVAGNAAVEEAKKFNEAVNIDGVIMTKADCDAKGGSILSISNELKKPILFIGTGQELKDLLPFKKEWLINKLFD